MREENETRIENRRFFLVFRAIAGRFPSGHKYEAHPWWVGPCQGPQHTQVLEHQERELVGQWLGRQGHESVPLLMPEGLSSGTTGSTAPFFLTPVTKCS